MAEWKNPKTDWVTNPKNPVAEDFNRIEGNIDFLKTDIETKKGLIVDAISDMNQPALVTDTHAELANKIRSISSDANAATGDVEKGKTFYSGGTKKTGTLELTGDAATGDVLSGKTFYNNDLKAQRTGAMPNKGAVTITPGQTEQTIPAGYHNGSGKVPAVVFDAAKVLTGTTIAGKTGTMPNRGKTIITPGTTNKSIAQGYHNGQGYVVGDADLKAENILQGVSIFGVAGTMKPLKWAKGSAVSVDRILTVTGLDFEPKFIYGIQKGTPLAVFMYTGERLFKDWSSTTYYNFMRFTVDSDISAGIFFSVRIVDPGEVAYGSFALRMSGPTTSGTSSEYYWAAYGEGA